MNITNPKLILLIITLHVFAGSAFGIIAKFSYVKQSNCAPARVIFTNLSTTGPGITYIWNFGLGGSVDEPTNTDRYIQYDNPGKYTVTLIATDGTNSDTTSQNIIIAQGPTASFTANSTIGCVPLLANFSSTSTPGDTAIDKINWNFHDGSYGDGKDLSHTYGIAGNYNIVLTVTDKNGCVNYVESDTIITAISKPRIIFFANDTFACSPPVNVTFNNLSSGTSNLDFKWDFGNGKTSNTFEGSSVYNNFGKYTVKLKATDLFGCTDSLIKPNYISIGDPQGTIEVFDTLNNPVPSLNLCSGYYKFVFSLKNLPNYTWVIKDNGKTTTIVNTNAISYVVKDTGTFEISLTYGKNSSCTYTIKKIFAKSQINADFTLDETTHCSLPQTIKLKNNSENGTSFSWYFNGQLFSSKADTSFNLTNNEITKNTYPRLYAHELDIIRAPFTLVAVNSDGCTDYITKNANISFPLARFIPDKVSGCIPLEVNFFDVSRSIHSIDSYTYAFGADTITTDNNHPVKYTFTKPGEYYISEIIKSGECSDTSYLVKIVAGDKLTPDFTVTPSEVCNGGNIHITGTSNNNAAINKWHLTSDNIFDLNFISAPDEDITVFSDSTGLKNINLKVDYNGCISDTTKYGAFKINGPVGNFAESFSCDSPLIYHFKSEIIHSSSNVWTINNIQFKNTDTLTYAFAASGNHQVKLVVTDSLSNCVLSRSKLIQVRQIKADFNLKDSSICVGDTAFLNASVSSNFVNTCYNEGFLWGFDDNTPTKRTFLQNYSHIYKNRGDYDITLVANAENGCIDSLVKEIHVHEPIFSLNVNPKSGCVPSTNFTLKLNYTDTTISKWIWNFGDGNMDSTNNKIVFPTYKSNYQRTFYPILKVYDKYECYATMSIPIRLNEVYSNFQAIDNSICTGQSVTFKPTDASLDSLFWDFGNGNTSKISNSSVYNDFGNYSVSLIGYKYGCSDTITKPNYVSVNKPDANFTASHLTANCYPDTIYFKHKILDGSAAADWTWTFGANQLNTKSDSVMYIFTRAGTYKAQLKVKTINGCPASTTKDITIHGPDATFSFSPKKICYNETVTFDLISKTNVTEWQWIYGDGDKSQINQTKQSHRYKARGKIIPSIELRDGTGCIGTLSMDTLWVSEVRAHFTSSGDTAKTCFGKKLDFTNTSLFSNKWNWLINNVSVSTDFNLNDFALYSAGANTIKLVATGTDNCTDTFARPYTVFPNPDFSITGDSVLCKGLNTIPLTVNTNPGWTIQWKPATGLSNPAAFSTVADPPLTTNYTAQVTDANGCITEHNKTITAIHPIQITRIPTGDTAIHVGQTIQLLVADDSTGNLVYTWAPGYNITCLNCSSPFITPINDYLYKLNIKNVCFERNEDFNIQVLYDFYLEAPSAFTPNDDGNNDIFRFEEKDIKIIDLKIFNRWGKIVFSTTDVKQGWDGKVNGKIQNMDTYTFYVTAETIYGYKFEKKGNFLLIK